jgi:CBS domain-containing protein
MATLVAPHLTARDVMVTRLVTFRPHLSMDAAMRTLVKRGISGAPVVDDEGRLVGMLSEYDCLRVVAGDHTSALFEGPAGRVEDFMSRDVRTIGPDTVLATIADRFLTQHIRRLPVVEGDRLLGQVSRRDILRGLQRAKAHAHRHRYPDYRRPA